MTRKRRLIPHAAKIPVEWFLPFRDSDQIRTRRAIWIAEGDLMVDLHWTEDVIGSTTARLNVWMHRYTQQFSRRRRSEGRPGDPADGARSEDFEHHTQPLVFTSVGSNLPSPPEPQFEPDLEDGRAWQAYREPRPKRVWCAQCPGCQKRTNALYLVADSPWLRCRECHGLSYRSQAADPQGREEDLAALNAWEAEQAVRAEGRLRQLAQGVRLSNASPLEALQAIAPNAPWRETAARDKAANPASRTRSQRPPKAPRKEIPSKRIVTEAPDMPPRLSPTLFHDLLSRAAKGESLDDGISEAAAELRQALERHGIAERLRPRRSRARRRREQAEGSDPGTASDDANQ